MKLTPHISLSFNGQCEAAFRFNEQCLSGTIAFMLTWGNSPMAAEAPPGWDAKIAHATLKVGDTVITGSDAPPERYQQPKGLRGCAPDGRRRSRPSACFRRWRKKATSRCRSRRRSGRFGSESWSIGSEYPGRSIVKEPSSRHPDRTRYSERSKMAPLCRAHHRERLRARCRRWSPSASPARSASRRPRPESFFFLTGLEVSAARRARAISEAG